MKRFNKYLFCICLFIISMFIFSNDIKATNFSYNGVTFNSEDIVFKVNDYFGFDVGTDYPYHIAYKYADGSLYYVFLNNMDFFSYEDKEFLINTNDIFYVKNDKYYISPFGFSSFGYTLNAWKNVYLYKYDFNTNLEIFGLSYGSDAYAFEPTESSKYQSSGRVALSLDSERSVDFSESDYVSHFLDKFVYSNVNIRNNNYNFDFYYTKDKTINMEKTFANDLEGNEIYNIRVDFENVFDASYKYQVRNEYEEWQDVTSNVLDAYQYGYYYYDYTLRFNSKVYARVLDSNDNVIATNEIEVIELDDYIKISHAPASDLNNRYINVLTIDLRNAYNENYTYQYSYDNETFYNMSVDIDNQIFYLNHAVNIPIYFRIVDSESNVIYTRDYEVYFEDLEKEILISEKTEFTDGIKKINISLDFSQYINFYDMYNFKIIIDGVEYNEETFLLNFESTEDNFIKYIDIELYLDNLLIEDIGYRCGTFGTGGGSDIDNFDDMYDKVLENELSSNESYFDMFKNSFNEFKFSIKSIFDDISTFWLGMPVILQRFFIVIFSIILFAFVIRFIL